MQLMSINKKSDDNPPAISVPRRATCSTIVSQARPFPFRMPHTESDRCGTERVLASLASHTLCKGCGLRDLVLSSFVPSAREKRAEYQARFCLAPIFIGASPSEPHTSATELRDACSYVSGTYDQPYTES